jgi:hypothetical protein
MQIETEGEIQLPGYQSQEIHDWQGVYHLQKL